MPWEPIHKTPSKQAVAPNLWDYEEVRAGFQAIGQPRRRAKTLAGRIDESNARPATTAATSSRTPSSPPLRAW